jgi:hypothetical protein
MHQRVYIEHYDPVNKKPFECPICMDEVIIGSGYVFEKCKHNYCGSVSIFICITIRIYIIGLILI